MKYNNVCDHDHIEEYCVQCAANYKNTKEPIDFEVELAKLNIRNPKRRSGGLRDPMAGYTEVLWEVINSINARLDAIEERLGMKL